MIKLLNGNYLRFLFIVVMLWMGFDSMATLYSYVRVKTDNPNGGLVSVVKDGDKTGNFAEEMEKIQSSSQIFSRPSSATHNYKLQIQEKEGYLFAGWVLNNKIVSMERDFVVGVTTYTTTSPGTGSVYTAHFINKPAASVSVSLPYGAPTISPEENRVGDEVTLMYKLPNLPKYANVKNVMLEFSHWEDGEGNILSYDQTFKTIVEKECQYMAVLKELGEVPQVGKYYRIRTFSNRVLTIEGGYKFSMPLASGKTVDPTLLRWALPKDFNPEDFNTNGSLTNLAYPRTDTIRPICPEASPSTIFYIESGTEKNGELTKVVMKGQGVDTKTLTSNNTLDFVPMNNNFYGYYGFQSSAVSKAGFKMKFNNNGCDVYLGSFGEEDPYCAMAVQPIDEDHMDYFWFGAQPSESMYFEGGYWTSMYTAFPYECRDNVEAYYVAECVAAKDATYAVVTRIEGDCVPANTAVLLKCKSLESKGNRLLPLHPDTQIPSVSGNLLKGEFQLYTDANGSGKKKFDSAVMRVFGADKDGQPGFYNLVKNAEGGEIELASNKAYLDLSAFSSPLKVNSLRIITHSGVSGIDIISSDYIVDKCKKHVIYNLMGQPVKNPSKGEIYIVDGKKIIY